MKTPLGIFALVCGLLLAGCGHLEVTPETNPNRVVTGTVQLRMPTDLPGDASVLVRVLDGTRADPGLKVLGEQTIQPAGNPPVPFRVEFLADDGVLRHGLTLEARVSFGGQLRYYNINAIGIGPGNVGDKLTVVVDPVKR